MAGLRNFLNRSQLPSFTAPPVRSGNAATEATSKDRDVGAVKVTNIEDTTLITDTVQWPGTKAEARDRSRDKGLVVTNDTPVT